MMSYTVPNDVIYYLQLCNLWWKELCVWGGAVWLVGGASKRGGGVGTKKGQYAVKTLSVLSATVLVSTPPADEVSVMTCGVRLFP